MWPSSSGSSQHTLLFKNVGESELRRIRFAFGGSSSSGFVSETNASRSGSIKADCIRLYVVLVEVRAAK